MTGGTDHDRDDVAPLDQRENDTVADTDSPDE